jgi:prevent-host-death family protein
MTATVPFTHAKAHLSDLVDRVATERERFTVTRHGRPAAVMINPDELESIEETLEVLRDPELVRSLRRSMRQAEQGKTIPLEEARDGLVQGRADA